MMMTKTWATGACLRCAMVVVLLGASAANASFWDTFPVISQIKSAVQAIGGDSEAARQTQINFANQMPVVSQIKSAVEAATGDDEAARRTQMHFLKNAETLVDGTPVVGHIKGGIHMIAGDKERGLDIIRGATSTTGAVVGGVLGGPAGAMAGGLATDAIITNIDTAIAAANDERDPFRPYGMVDYIANIDKKSVGEHFDVITGMGADVAGGMMAKKKTSGGSMPSSSPAKKPSQKPTTFGAGEGSSSPSRTVSDTIVEGVESVGAATKPGRIGADVVVQKPTKNQRGGVTTVIRDGVEIHADHVVVKDGVEVNKFDLDVDRPDILIVDAEVEYKALQPQPGDVPFKSIVADLDSPMIERNLHPAEFDHAAAQVQSRLAAGGDAGKWFTPLTGLGVEYLERVRQTDFRVINDVRGTTNCYFCTAAAFKGCSVSTLTTAYRIKPMSVWNAASGTPRPWPPCWTCSSGSGYRAPRSASSPTTLP